MHAFILTGPSQNGIDTLYDAFVAERNIAPVDMLIVDLAPDATSIGIKEIREFRSSIPRMPIQSAVRLGVIRHAESLTNEAANALLKTLEEPPGSAVIVLTTTTPTLLPQTILSRCIILRSHEDENSVTDAFDPLIKSLTGGSGKSPGRFMALVDTHIASAADAGRFLQALAMKSTEFPIPVRRKILSKIDRAGRMLSSNVSYKAVLDSLAMDGLDKQKTGV